MTNIDALIERLRQCENSSEARMFLAEASGEIFGEAASALAELLEQCQANFILCGEKDAEIAKLQHKLDEEISASGYEFVSTKPEMSQYITSLGKQLAEAQAEIAKLREALGQMVEFGRRVPGWHSGILDRAIAALGDGEDNEGR